MSEKETKDAKKPTDPPATRSRRPFSTKVEDDVFADARGMRRARFSVEAEQVLEELWDINPELNDILDKAPSLEEAREAVYAYLNRIERDLFEVQNPVHILENATVRDAIRVFKSVIGPINEKRTGVSALDCLWKLAQDRRTDLRWEVSVGYLHEMLHLFKAISGQSNIYRRQATIQKGVPSFLRLSGREAAQERTEQLDRMADQMQAWFWRYPSGLEEQIIARRDRNRKRILDYFEATEDDWNDFGWHLTNVVKTSEPLIDLIDISRERRHAVRKAVEARLPIGVTPYYLSLLEPDRSVHLDHAVQAQVIPPPDYVEAMTTHSQERDEVFDYMGENDTSPVDLVTRRYPMICILKPYNTCAQICVYCQRNWEIDECMAPDAAADPQQVDAAIDWIAEHKGIGEVLVTGGDPVLLPDAEIDRILGRLARIDHVYRIRIGTRTPVVLPMRWTDGLIDTLAKYVDPGQRQVAVVTHFEHSFEITPESARAVARIRNRGLPVYNQAVFTIENSRRFETVKLRKDLKSIGVDPYYTFNMKGKEETRHLMVPLARILQERREEARLLPGLDRTDETVFNVPRLGKNHVRAMQDRRLVMIHPDGSRVYEFHPWEKNIVPIPPYNYTDVPIHDYLEALKARGEDPREYRTIWYYY